MKILSLLKHENLTTGVKTYRGKEEKLLPGSNFSSFPQYFQYISYFKSPVTYIFVNVVVRVIFFLNSANLICRVTDISKYFREFLGIRDNERRLHMILCCCFFKFVLVYIFSGCFLLYVVNELPSCFLLHNHVSVK